MTSNQSFAEVRPDAGGVTAKRTPRRGFVVAFGVAAALHAGFVLAQAGTAGAGLAGSPGMFLLHGNGSMGVHLAALIQVIAAVLLWRPGRGPWWPAGVSLLLLLAGFAQSAVGGAGNVTVHVPLGMSLFGAAVWLAVWAWVPRTAPAGERR